MRNRKLKVNSIIIPTLFSTLFIFACSTRPSYVLSESKMEKVLYDMYIAEGEISTEFTTFATDSTRKKELLNSVLKKHKITEAILDTSLAWYTGRLEKYFKITSKVSKRFTDASDKLRHQQEETTKSEANADHMILPVEKERFLLRYGDWPNNLYPFHADTVLNRYGGIYEIGFNILGVSSSLRPVVTLCVQCLDTTFVKQDTISRNGLFVSSLTIYQNKQAKKLYGTIYFPKINPESIVFIQNFSLSHSSRQRIEKISDKSIGVVIGN